jgi:hypothetical protein
MTSRTSVVSECAIAHQLEDPVAIGSKGSGAKAFAGGTKPVVLAWSTLFMLSTDTDTSG